MARIIANFMTRWPGPVIYVAYGAAALLCLQGLTRSQTSPFVFPAQADTTRHYVGTPKVWEKVRAAAGLPDVRLHDLRHTFASFGAAGGLSLPLIAAILGHKDIKTTQQYAHLADSPMKAAADRTAAAIDGAMRGLEVRDNLLQLGR